MINIELVIISYILISFLLFYYYSENANIEGACTSKPFYYNKKTKPDSNDFIGSPGEEYKTVSTQSMISAFVSKMDEIEASMVDIKKKIPVKFNLGVVNNTDGSPDMYVEGTLPNVSLSFLIKNPQQGPKGQPGDNAQPYGPTGEIGPIGIIGQDGYWGTTKDNLF
jgi:hypothetical protein